MCNADYFKPIFGLVPGTESFVERVELLAFGINRIDTKERGDAQQQQKRPSH